MARKKIREYDSKRLLKAAMERLAGKCCWAAAAKGLRPRRQATAPPADRPCVGGAVRLPACPPLCALRR